ncbi:condensation domain-containing protein [Gordonia iterans]
MTGASPVGISDGFFDLGGNSLSATRVTALLEAALGRPVPVRLLFEAVDLGDFCRAVEELPGAAIEEPVLIAGDDDDGPAPLAPAQERIWQAVRAGRGHDWNVPIAMRLTGELDLDVLAAALLDVVNHHEALRLRYRDSAAGPQIDVAPTEEVAIRLRAELVPCAASEESLDRVLTEIAWRPMDLGVGPIRARVLRIDPRNHVLVVVVHHLSADGQSMGVLTRDVVAAFAARCHGAEPVLTATAVRFTDYARWRTEVLGQRGSRTAEFARQLEYWTGMLGTPELRARPGADDQPWDSAGDTVEFRLSAEVHRALERCAARESVGLFAVLQAAFAVVLAARSGDDEVRVGTANANRSHAALDGVVGNFAEDLPMRLTIDDGAPFAALVRQVQDQLLGGLANPDVSVPDLMRSLGLARDPAGPAGGPFFPATLILQRADVAELGDAELDLGPVVLRREPVANTVAKHELEVALLETRDQGEAAGIRGALVYPVRRLDRGSAATVVGNLVAVLREVSQRPAATVGECRARCDEDVLV